MTKKPPLSTSRRLFLLAGLAAAFSRRALADDLDPIREIGRKAGLAEFKSTYSENFRALGDSPDDYRSQALGAAESIASEFVDHFEEKGFKVSLPAFPQTIVTLAGPRSYAKFTGDDEDSAVGGHYDIETNRLVVFDFRAGGRPISAQAEIINSRTLAHETIHQLTYNTGLLDRRGDVPLCVNEGLGTYGEVWRPKGRGKIGQINTGWLDVLKGRGAASRWIGLERLLTDDDLFRKPETQSQAYAQSWLLVHHGLKNRAALPRFRAYLDAIRRRKDSKSRLADFREHLGTTEKIEADLKRHVARPVGG